MAAHSSILAGEIPWTGVWQAAVHEVTKELDTADHACIYTVSINLSKCGSQWQPIAHTQKARENVHVPQNAKLFATGRGLFIVCVFIIFYIITCIFFLVKAS